MSHMLSWSGVSSSTPWRPDSVSNHMRLKPSEAVAIRWHMGGFDNAAQGGSMAISQAYEKYPLAVKLHMADIEATYLVENDKIAKKI